MITSLIPCNLVFFSLSLLVIAFTIFFQSFQTLWLSRCGLHATEDLNRGKRVCLRTAEFRGDRMGTPIPSSQKGCTLENFVLELCPLLRRLREAERLTMQPEVVRRANSRLQH